jgi:hypothetical protein
LTIPRLFLYKWIWGWTAGATYGVYKLFKSKNPELSEKELAIILFNRRFKTSSNHQEHARTCKNMQEHARIKTYFQKYPEPSNLLDTCIAIVMIEFNVDVNDKKSYKYIKKVLLVKLYKNGYQIKGDK